jgi:hypothetical protein
MTLHWHSQLNVLLVRLESLVHPPSLILRRPHLRTPRDRTKDPYQTVWPLAQEIRLDGFQRLQLLRSIDMESYTFTAIGYCRRVMRCNTSNFAVYIIANS